MEGSLTIEIKGMRLFAAHGVHEEEGKLGNEFQLDLEIEFSARDKVITDLDDSINYVSVIEIVRAEMAIRQQLLETIVMKICDRIYEKYSQVQMIKISLRKITPPITNFIGSVGVSYTKSYK